MQDRDLDDLLAMAAANRPTPDPALLDRVLADALALQPPVAAQRPRRPQSVGPQSVGPQSVGLLARISLAFGGGAVLAGVTSTLLLGLAVGYTSPATLDYLTGGSVEAVDLFPEADFLTSEG